MLGKLMKYEFRATARYFLPVYGGLIVAALLFRLNNNVLDRIANDHIVSVLSGLLGTVYGMLVIGLLALTFIISVRRFSRNLLGSEGYLMFTLPAKTSDNIFGKMIPSAVWGIGSALIIILSILLLIPEFRLIDLPRLIKEGLNYINIELGFWNTFIFIVELLVMVIISVCSNLMSIYFCLSVGQLANEHKFLAAVGVYFGLSVFWQIIVSILTAIILSAHPFEPLWLIRLGDWFANSPVSALQVTFLVAILFSILFFGLYYFFTHKLINKHLNLA